MTHTCTCQPAEPPQDPLAAPLLPEEDYWAVLFGSTMFDEIRYALAEFEGGGQKWRTADAGAVAIDITSRLRLEIVPLLEKVILEVYKPTVVAELDRLADADASPETVRARARQIGRMPAPLPVKIPDLVRSKWTHVWRVANGFIHSAIWRVTHQTQDDLATAILNMLQSGLPPLMDEAMAKSFLPTMIEELRRLAAASAGPDDVTARADELAARLAEGERQGRA
jgi:hypothetical protein